MSDTPRGQEAATPKDDPTALKDLEPSSEEAQALKGGNLPPDGIVQPIKPPIFQNVPPDGKK